MPRFSILLLLLVTLLSGCRKGEFTVDISLPKTATDTYTLLYYASDSERGMLVDMPALVQNGTARVKCPSINPTLVYVFRSTSEWSVAFLAERGDKITITGDNPDPAYWTIGGNKVNDAMTQWRVSNRNALSARDSGKINAAVAVYVKENAGNPAATLILLLYYDEGADPEGFDKLYASLKDDAADPKWTDLVSRNDLLPGFGARPVKTGPLVLRTAGNDVDTVRFNKAPALFYFAANTTESRREDMQLLKQLLRERKDSSAFSIVDVNMEADSSSWRYQIRGDTLKGAVRAWMPLGFSDTTAARLGVVRLPYFVVIARGGKIRYQGSDADKAMSLIRK